MILNFVFKDTASVDPLFNSYRTERRNWNCQTHNVMQRSKMPKGTKKIDLETVLIT